MTTAESIPSIPQVIRIRFWRKVNKTNRCWNWIGASDKYGYGRINWSGKTRVATRISWAIHNGDPGSMFVLHHCDNPSCVRPSHLFLGDQKDNMSDASKKGRLQGERPHLKKSHCLRGHPYDEKNTYISSSGGKFCRACHRDSQNKRNRKSGSKPSSCRICDICKKKAKGHDYALNT